MERVFQALKQAGQGRGGNTWRLKDTYTWHLGMWFRGGLGSVSLSAGLRDLGGVRVLRHCSEDVLF